MCNSWIGSLILRLSTVDVMLCKCVKLVTVLLAVEANSLAVSMVISTTLDDWKCVFATWRNSSVICFKVELLFGQERAQIPSSASLFDSVI